jgi:hypothetical protein
VIRQDAKLYLKDLARLSLLSEKTISKIFKKNLTNGLKFETVNKLNNLIRGIIKAANIEISEENVTIYEEEEQKEIN